MNIRGAFLFVLFLMSILHAKETHHLFKKLITGHRPLDSTAFTSSIIDAANKYEGKDVPRFAQYDFAFPSDSTEYLRLNGNGILLIIGLTHDSSEIPFRRVYLNFSNKEVSLEKILDTKLIYSNSKANALFGGKTIVSIYLLPIIELLQRPELKLDWMKNRIGFSLGALAPLNDLKYEIIRLEKDKIDDEYLKSFILREFPLVSSFLKENH